MGLYICAANTSPAEPPPSSNQCRGNPKFVVLRHVFKKENVQVKFLRTPLVYACASRSHHYIFSLLCVFYITHSSEHKLQKALESAAEQCQAASCKGFSLFTHTENPSGTKQMVAIYLTSGPGISDLTLKPSLFMP